MQPVAEYVCALKTMSICNLYPKIQTSQENVELFVPKVVYSKIKDRSENNSLFCLNQRKQQQGFMNQFTISAILNDFKLQ